MRTYPLGELEELVLLSVAGLDDEVYTVSIQQYLEQKADRFATMGAIYRALDRLEGKGYVASWMSAVTPERGGKRKRLYRVTGTGKAALCHAREARNRIWEEIEQNPSWKLI